MPLVRWIPPAALFGRAEPLEVRVGGGERLILLDPNIPTFVEPDDVATVTAATIAAIPGSTVTAGPQ